MDLFGSDSDDETIVNSSAIIQSIIPRIRNYIDRLIKQTCHDLNQLHQEPLSTELAESFVQFQNQLDVTCESLARRGCEAALCNLKSKGKWEHVCWRELFVISKLILVGIELRKNDFETAVLEADYAFILGAPKEETNLVFRLVAPILEGSRASTETGQLLGLQEVHELVATQWNDAVLSQLVPLPSSTSIKVFPGFLNSEELELFRVENVPCVMTNGAGSWAAMNKWRDLNYWKTMFGNRIVPVELGGGATDSIANWKEEMMPLEQFIDSLGGSSVAYLAQHPIFDQIMGLNKDIVTPLFCTHNGRQLKSRSIWMGTASTVTPLHFDSFDNFLVQVAGLKLAVLFAATETPNLYTIESSTEIATASQGNISSIDVASPDYSAFPKYRDAVGQLVLLKPGDVLFMPRGTWHYMRSLTPSLSTNFWFE